MTLKTEYRIELELDFYVLLHQKCSCFFGRLRKINVILATVGSGAAFATLSTDLRIPEVVGAVAAFFVFVLAVLELAIGYTEKANMHERFRQRYADLRAEVNDLDLAELNRRYAKLCADDSECVKSLKYPAYNEARRAAGLQLTRKTSRWENFIDALSS